MLINGIVFTPESLSLNITRLEILDPFSVLDSFLVVADVRLRGISVQYPSKTMTNSFTELPLKHRPYQTLLRIVKVDAFWLVSELVEKLISSSDSS